MAFSKAEPTALDLALAAFKAAEQYRHAFLVSTGEKGAVMREDVALAAYNDAKAKLLIALIPAPTTN